MTAGNDFDPQDDQPKLFSARLTPHRSLNRTGFLVLMAFLCAVSFVAGVAFLLMGAWPVFGFFGLDMLLLYWAFRVSYRSAAAYEEIKVTAATLTVRKVDHHGRSREWQLNPLWVKLDKVTHEEYGIEHLLLVSRGKQLAVANFLGPDEKADFAVALGDALSEARRGVVRT